MSPGRRYRPKAHGGGDSGQIGVLVIGFSLLALLTVTVVMAASSVYIGQKKLLSAADGAAVAAADTFSLAQSDAGGGPAGLRAEADPRRSWTLTLSAPRRNATWRIPRPKTVSRT